MAPQMYDRVRLLTDRFSNEGASKGALGYVIEIYENGTCEVEFSDSNGITYAQVVTQPEELERAEPG